MTLIDIAVPADQNITRTEEEKVEKYQELALEIRRIHGASKVTIIPIVIGALGSILKGAKTWFGKLDVPHFLGSVQLSAILGTAHLLRKVWFYQIKPNFCILLPHRRSPTVSLETNPFIHLLRKVLCL